LRWLKPASFSDLLLVNQAKVRHAFACVEVASGNSPVHRWEKSSGCAICARPTTEVTTASACCCVIIATTQAFSAA
jgi:hypothetical protein